MDRFDPSLFLGDALDFYEQWPAPTVILSDGAYGIGGFPGDPNSPTGLAAWYEPHVAAWSKRALFSTTLWFWGTEVGWATVHPLLESHGWVYRGCNIWDKGIAHIAGNVNTQTMRKFPVVTEVCAQYIREPTLPVGDKRLTLKEWLRHEWQRAGLSLHLTNDACGVKNAATRKYMTLDDVWYYPPIDKFELLVAYANEHGKREGAPYFSVTGREPMTGEEFRTYRHKFYCPLAQTNVWREPTDARNNERLKTGPKALHANQKPLRILDQLIQCSSDEGDVVWEPFGGLCTASLAAFLARRRSYAAEIDHEVHHDARSRLSSVSSPIAVEGPRSDTENFFSSLGGDED